MILIVIGSIFLGAAFIGVPIAFSIGLASSTWILFIEGIEPTLLARRFFDGLGSFPLLAIPLFIMMGILAERTGILSQVVVWLQMLLGRTRGGMAYINVVNSMIFAGISGTAVADIASLGRLEIQMMTRAGYPLKYAAALTAATSVIGPIIPPSVVMIIYGLTVGNISVGALFIGGVIPGLLLGAGFSLMAWYTTRRGAYGVLLERPNIGEFLRQTLRVLPLLALPAIILGGIMSGVFTVTESAATGVVYIMLVGLLSRPRLRAKDLYDATIYSGTISAVAGMLLGVGAIVSWILTANLVTQTLADLVAMLTIKPTLFLLVVVSVLFILGMLMDPVPIIVTLAPLLAPIAKQYGIADIHFGLVFVITCVVGVVTPPVGIVLFMTSSIANVKFEALSVAVFPFVVWMMAVVILMVFFPSITIWLPRLVGF